jgi:hypothetical protein
MPYIRIQPQPLIDKFMEDGVEWHPLPYPFYVAEDGSVQRQDVWKGNPAWVIGFVADKDRHEVDVTWEEVDPTDPARLAEVVGMFLVVADTDWRFATFSAAIGKAEIVSEAEVDGL